MMAYQVNKEKREQKIKAAFDMLEQGIEEFWTSDKYMEYLQVMSKFHNYSINNQILIASQYPEASHVAGYVAWKGFGRHVRANEKGITIFAPITRKEEVEVKNQDGNITTEERTYLTFIPVTVFDVSQTEGKELPDIVTTLTGDVVEYNNIMQTLKDMSPYPIEFGDTGDANGYCSHGRKIIMIKENMSELQTIKTTVHELAHAILHGDSKATTRNQKEVEAESVAFIVLNHFDLDTSDYSFGYVASWSQDQDKELLKQSMNTINSEAKNIITKLENGLEKLAIRDKDVRTHSQEEALER